MSRSLRIVKFFAFASLFISLLAGITDRLCPQFFGGHPLSWVLALHPSGLSQGYFWQIFTHPFIHPAPGGFDLLYLISLGFSSYLLWKIGAIITTQRGIKHFITLFTVNTLLTSCIAIIVWSASGIPMVLAGGTPILYALLLATIFILPEIDLLLFLAIPVKAKWFILGSMGAFLLIDLSHGNFVQVFGILGTLLFTYLYCLLFWRIHSPFKAMRSLENLLLGTFPSDNLRGYAQNAKIYDIKTGQVLLSDDAFVDACLAKIADKGPASLSWREQWRLKKISKKKKAAARI